MNADSWDYDPRYLAGIVLFNRGDFFEAHEVWESLWLSAEVGEHRRFIQGLIQAAVALHHLETNNSRGAAKLFVTARDYMTAYPDFWLGLHHPRFWQLMEAFFAYHGLIERSGQSGETAPPPRPRIELAPEPSTWPDPTKYLDLED